MSEKTASFREFGKITGYSEAMVRKWISKGRISQKCLGEADGRKFIYVDRAQKELEANAPKTHNSSPEKRAKTRHNKAERFSEKPVPLPTASSWNPDEPATGLEGELTTAQMLVMGINDLEKLKKIREIQKMEQAFKREAKLLVPIADVDKALYEAGHVLREALENFPTRVVDEARDAETRDDALFYMESEVDIILNMIANIGDNLPR